MLLDETIEFETESNNRSIRNNANCEVRFSLALLKDELSIVFWLSEVNSHIFILLRWPNRSWQTNLEAKYDGSNEMQIWTILLICEH